MSQRPRPLRWRIKKALIDHGPAPSHLLEEINGYLRLGNWLDAYSAPARYDSKDDLYKAVYLELGPGPMDYLEFGCRRGKSLLAWSRLNRHPESRFWGFDTFEGLPEIWHAGTKTVDRGKFDVGGQLPQIDDDRVHYVRGLFQDTLRDFLASYQPAATLLVHMDADLYSSTLYTLATLDPILTPGVVLIFDEFSIPTHEFRALTDYCSAFRRNVTPFASVGAYNQLALRLARSSAV